MPRTLSLLMVLAIVYLFGRITLNGWILHDTNLSIYLSQEASSKTTVTNSASLSFMETSILTNISAHKSLFVFFIGLEGTGHHLTASVLHKSPATEQLGNIHLTIQQGESMVNVTLVHRMQQLSTLLFTNAKTTDLIPTNDLLHRHCYELRATAHNAKTNLPPDPLPPDQKQRRVSSLNENPFTQVDFGSPIIQSQSPTWAKVSPDQPINAFAKQTNDMYSQLVDLLRDVDARARPLRQGVPLTMGLNAAGAAGSLTHMASYPQDLDSCRSQKYPDLDLLYQACNDASVLCGHVYLYRDPLEVVRSTLRRKFNPTPLTAMTLYSNMLQVIFAQMSRYPERNFGCMGLFEKNPQSSSSKVNNSNSIEVEKWNPLDRLFGWTNRTEFQEHLNSTFRHRARNNEGAGLDAIIQEAREHVFAYNSLYLVHQQVIELCRQQVHDNEHILNKLLEGAESSRFR